MAAGGCSTAAVPFAAAQEQQAMSAAVRTVKQVSKLDLDLLVCTLQPLHHMLDLD